MFVCLLINLVIYLILSGYLLSAVSFNKFDNLLNTYLWSNAEKLSDELHDLENLGISLKIITQKTQRLWIHLV